MILVETNVLFALSLTVMAGLATGIGSIIALFAKTTNTKFLAGSLGFSAGVMIYVSMIEIFQKSRTYIASATNDTVGYYIAVVSFFVGILLIGLIDYFVPSTEGDIGNLTENETRSIALKRMGFMTALAIGIHNFPEGLATFTSALKDPHLGLAIAVAIAIPVSYTHLRAHETDSYLVCRLLLEKKKQTPISYADFSLKKKKQHDPIL